MLAKNSHWIFVLTVAVVLATLGAWTLPAKADTVEAVALQQADNSCLSCHEDLYYLHDTGCWYCMSDVHKDRCVDCHEGNPAAFQENESHYGMLAHPQENNGEKCMECHDPEETQLRMVKFESANGFDTVIYANTYTPSHPAQTGFSETQKVSLLTDNLGWLTFAFFAFGIWLVLVLKS